MTELKQNPANARNTGVTVKNRVPMSIPTLKLQAAEIPGFHLHWMSGTQGRISQALRAGYQFVSPEEVNLTNPDIAGAFGATNSSDLGTRVSALAGGEADGQAARLYLMKLPEEFWQEDQRLRDAANEKTAAMLRGGSAVGDVNPHGNSQQYIPEAQKKIMLNLFTPKH